MAQSKIFLYIESAISEFDVNALDLDAIKENILSYSAINMVYGKLRPETPPKVLIEASGAVDPMSAEKDDLRRQKEFASPVAVGDPEVVARLAELHDCHRAFPPFDFHKNIANAICAIVAISGRLPAASEFKNAYISTLNAIQNTSIPCREAVVVSYDNPVLLDTLWREGLIVPESSPVFAPFEQEQITRRIGDGFAFIKAVDEDLHDAILSMIGTIGCIRRDGSSGTVSSMIGFLWLNPTPEWTVLDYAENIVHEYIHNMIFLDDMVMKVFTTPHWYAPEDGLVISAIKKYPRGVNISYHSVLVAVGLIIFMNKATQMARAEELTSGLRSTFSG